ncbi:MAG: hypothetical protein HQL66_14005 [Magnetococcales bacterium]|nr:hypothetical protein [Magnetococcales bacterium]
MNNTRGKIRVGRFAAQRQSWEMRRFIRNGRVGVMLVPMVETAIEESVRRVKSYREAPRQT